MRSLLILGLGLIWGLGQFFAELALAADTVPQYFQTPQTRQNGLPFSDAVQVGQLLILSGQVGASRADGRLVPGGIAAESRQALDNIGAILKEHGLDYSDIVKCTVMLADMNQWAAFNSVYQNYFSPNRLPARSAFGASGLALGGAVEIECWAALRHPHS